MNEKVVLGATGVESPELNALPSLLVTVCGVCVVFFQMTVVPALIVMVFGLNVKVPVLSVVIVTIAVAPVTAFVAVGLVLVPPLP